MPGIQIKNNIILYYGNQAGYIEKGKAIVDSMFQNRELSEYLTEKQGLKLEWRNGTLSRIVKGTLDTEGKLQVLKKCRIHQLKPETDVFMKFIGYKELKEQFGEPDPANYRVVYDGEVETNELEELFNLFRLDYPPGYEGYGLSMSDVIELYDDSGSSFYYIGHHIFHDISFQSQEQEPYQGPTMEL